MEASGQSDNVSHKASISQPILTFFSLGLIRWFNGFTDRAGLPARRIRHEYIVVLVGSLKSVQRNRIFT